ncbi:MAG: 50S ribosomal protein L17 [Myxococcales bacterium FL481]|nr:MAG: 50S ribosomal protein L17 [Myxococcales bacterium FL481]
MRHQKTGRQLGRNSAHRKAMFRNMVTSLLEHERIRTTEAKAKELRRFVERTISIGLRLGDLLTKPKEERTPEERARYAHALRMAGRMVRSREVLHKLFDEIAPKLQGRPGGYTRVLKMMRRPGDAAQMALIELVTRDEAPAAESAETPAASEPAPASA